MEDFPSDDAGLTTILELVSGDREMEKIIRKLSKSEDDPVLLFSWHYTTLAEFWSKAVAYGVGGGSHRPPPPIFGGVHPVGPASLESMEQLQHEILSYLSSQSLGPQVIEGGGAGGAVGLACSYVQYGMACSRLGGMELQPWFQAVLAMDAPLTGPLACVYLPRPGNPLGVCDRVPLTGALVH